MKRLIVLAFCVQSFLSYASFTPESGVVKSRDKEVFVSCAEKTDEGKKCHFYLQEKGQEAEPLSREFLLVGVDERASSVASSLDRRGGQEFVPAMLLPITATVTFCFAYGGPAFVPLYLFAPLDLVAGPVAVMVEGVRHIYKKIQATYLKKALGALTDLSSKKTVRLSGKDFDLFVEMLR